MPDRFRGSSVVGMIIVMVLWPAMFPGRVVSFQDSSIARISKPQGGVSVAVLFPFQEVYRIPLRVHLAGSSRSLHDFIPIYNEINRIWFSQAGICFDVESVMDDVDLDSDGFDMWFTPDLGGFNGYFDGEYIQMKDVPVLAPAENPSSDPAARTAAHELGHALGLGHRQDSVENLMRSKTFGWRLYPEEIEIARQNAAEITLPQSADDQDSCPIQ
ncbi:MAG: hypothetical protein KJ950_15820 [Proteobacteria bacterium]|nr:hypothetical protein [Pseudomonadota bacterium]MBU1688813.1 hypothetical protein [Pseudomonadota bacterium]